MHRINSSDSVMIRWGSDPPVVSISLWTWVLIRGRVDGSNPWWALWAAAVILASRQEELRESWSLAAVWMLRVFTVSATRMRSVPADKDVVWRGNTNRKIWCSNIDNFYWFWLKRNINPLTPPLFRTDSSFWSENICKQFPSFWFWFHFRLLMSSKSDNLLLEERRVSGSVRLNVCGSLWTF